MQSRYNKAEDGRQSCPPSRPLSIILDCTMKPSHVDNLQRNDVGGERVRHGSDALAQGVIFGAGASRGTPGLPQPAGVAYSQADSGDPNQERPSSLCPVRGSHSFRPGRVSYHSCTCNLQIKKKTRFTRQIVAPNLQVKKKCF